MNHYVQVNLTSYGNYSDGESSNEEMEILGSFLTSDVGCDSASFKEWVKKDNSTIAVGNLTYLEKAGDFILLSYDDFIFPEAEQIKIPKQAFISLLDDWEKVYKQKPHHILITYDGRQFTVEGIND